MKKKNHEIKIEEIFWESFKIKINIRIFHKNTRKNAQILSSSDPLKDKMKTIVLDIYRKEIMKKNFETRNYFKNQN